MPALPLSSRLAQALIAYTIEFDDEAEQRILHGTTVGGLQGMRAGGVWFTSQVMWSNFIRHMDNRGRPVREGADFSRGRQALEKASRRNEGRQPHECTQEGRGGRGG